LNYHERTKKYGNYFTVFLQRMKLPPMGDEMLSRAAAQLPMRSAEWQSVQEPDTNVEPDDGKFKWDGVSSRILRLSEHGKSSAKLIPLMHSKQAQSPRRPQPALSAHDLQRGRQHR
jgi:hypothetical protein